MKLLPIEILKHLGFTVPEDGIRLSQHEFNLHINLLKIIGNSVELNKIPIDTLYYLNREFFIDDFAELKFNPDLSFQVKENIIRILKTYYKNNIH